MRRGVTIALSVAIVAAIYIAMQREAEETEVPGIPTVVAPEN